MNLRQQRTRQARRALHQATTSGDRPRVVLRGARYPQVKKSHIVPRMYQQAFAVENQVMVHVLGRDEPVLMSIADAGTRSRFYRRVRPNGESIDDIEASLAEVETKSRDPLAELVAGEPVSVERKGALAQFFAVQLMRGPAFFEHRKEALVPMLNALEAKDFKPAGLALVNNDVQAARERLIEVYLSSTARFVTMLTTSVKIATVLAHMRWHVVRFEEPVLAYSDHPVVLWPMHLAASRPFERQGIGPLAALEIRVPIAPDAAIVMNWIDRRDIVDVRIDPRVAGELNAFTISQADRQWMHRPVSMPAIVTGKLEPVSRLLADGYSAAAALQSQRRARAQRFMERVKHRQHVHSVEVLEVRTSRTPRAA